MVDAHANFAVSLIATAPSPATSGTSLVVTSGEGTRFPAVPFNATIGPANTLLTPANSEIVRVTARATDTLTITRAQESTSARSVVVGDQIAATITTKTLTDIENYMGPAASVATYADRKVRASTSYTLNTSSAWTDVDTALDIVLTAKTGDWVECGLSGLWGSENFTYTLDVVSVVSGSPVNSWAEDGAPNNSHQGIEAWTSYPGSGTLLVPFGGSIIKKLVSGDISSGTVTLRLRYNNGGSASNKTLFGTAGDKFIFWARNHG